MGTFILKRKYYSGIWNIDGKIMNGATDNVKRDQNYYDSLAKELKNGQGGGLSGIDPNAAKLGSNAGVRTVGGQTRYDNPIKKGDIYNMGFKKGQNSVGLRQGAMNTWRNMGTFGKAATVAGGVALLGGAAKLISDKNKDNK